MLSEYEINQGQISRPGARLIMTWSVAQAGFVYPRSGWMHFWSATTVEGTWKLAQGTLALRQSYQLVRQ